MRMISEDMVLGDVLTENCVDEQKAMVMEAINSLSDNYRILVLLYYMEEQSIREISKPLHIPEGTVKRRLWTARKKLKEHLLFIAEIFFDMLSGKINFYFFVGCKRQGMFGNHINQYKINIFFGGSYLYLYMGKMGITFFYFCK